MIPASSQQMEQAKLKAGGQRLQHARKAGSAARLAIPCPHRQPRRRAPTCLTVSIKRSRASSVSICFTSMARERFAPAASQALQR